MNSSIDIDKFNNDIVFGNKMLNDEYNLMHDKSNKENAMIVQESNTFGIFGMAYAKFAKPRGLRLFEKRNSPSSNSLRAISYYGHPGSRLELNFHEYGKFYLEPKSVCIFPNTYMCTPDLLKSDYFIEQYFEYEEDKLEPKDDEKIFTVTATCTDVYELDVVAKTKEDAIEKARHVPSHEWIHLDIFPEIQESIILRVTKWAQFGIKE